MYLKTSGPLTKQYVKVLTNVAVEFQERKRVRCESYGGPSVFTEGGKAGRIALGFCGIVFIT